MMSQASHAAFPVDASTQGPGSIYAGMTKRELISAIIAAGVASRAATDTSFSQIAEVALGITDALLDAHNQRRE